MESGILYLSGQDCQNLHECNEAHKEIPTVRTESKEFKVTRMITECFGRYGNIPPPTNDGIDEDENDIALEDNDLHDVDLTKVIEE